MNIMVHGIILHEQVRQGNFFQFGKHQFVQLVSSDQKPRIAFRQAHQIFIMKTPLACENVKNVSVPAQRFVNSADQSACDGMRHICRIVNHQCDFAGIDRGCIPDESPFAVNAVDISLVFQFLNRLAYCIAREAEPFAELRLRVQTPAAGKTARPDFSDQVIFQILILVLWSCSFIHKVVSTSYFFYYKSESAFCQGGKKKKSAI